MIENINVDEIIEKDDFVIDNDNLADWAVRTIRTENKERDRLINIAKDQIAELEAQIDNITAQYAYKTARLESYLSRYFDTVPHNETKTQESYKLLSGTLVLTKPKVSLAAPNADNEVFNDFVRRTAPEYIKTVETVRWGDYKKTLKFSGDVVIDSNGEIVEGLVCTAVPPNFSVK
ncbi:MAG: host-nuclease inhibitor Gam family protein [Huintestinicola sp.]